MSRLLLIALLGIPILCQPVGAQDDFRLAELVPADSQVRPLPPIGPVLLPEAPPPLPEDPTLPPDDPLLLPEDPAATPEVTPADPEPKAQPKPAKPLWKGGFELGLDGTTGNSENFNVRFGFNAERKTKANVLSFDLDYHRETSDARKTAHRLFLDTRGEMFFKDSPWTWSFLHMTTEFDEFQAFDARATADTGLGYQFIDCDTTSLIARFGAGVSHEIGGPDDAYVPELVYGLDFDHQFSDRQKLTLTADYTPDVTAIGDYRLKTKTAWEILLDERTNLSLKLSILDRYDNTPNGKKPNDLDYAITLLWSF